MLPAFSLGYDDQGHGGLEDNDSYVYKSQSFFLAASKNYILASILQIGFHGALNYSIEQTEETAWPNLYTGIDLGINEELAFAGEYDFALNEQDPVNNGGDTTYANPVYGFFNVAFRWRFSESFYLEFAAKDIFENNTRPDGEPYGWGRALKLVYITRF
jgi:hypothetical protein